MASPISHNIVPTSWTMDALVPRLYSSIVRAVIHELRFTTHAIYANMKSTPAYRLSSFTIEPISYVRVWLEVASLQTPSAVFRDQNILIGLRIGAISLLIAAENLYLAVDARLFPPPSPIGSSSPTEARIEQLALISRKTQYVCCHFSMTGMLLLLKDACLKD